MGLKKRTMLSTAAYDNWKPTSHSQYGFQHNSMKAEAARLLYMLLRLENASPVTIRLNIKAERTTEGPAPASKLNDHKPARMIRALIHFVESFLNGFANKFNSQ